MSLLLGVNIDHVATLRQARYALVPDSPNAEPSPLSAALAAKAGGADSLTIHVRGDRRHMQTVDAFQLKAEQDLPINLEMGNTTEMLEFALELAPTFVCLVPETREEVTTEGGLDVVTNFGALKPTVETLRAAGIRVSLFIDPEPEQVQGSAKLGAEMIELHTGAFSNLRGAEQQEELSRLTAAAELGHLLSLQINAGHGINYENLELLWSVPHLAELNIGHSIVARSVFTGFETAVRDLLERMKTYPGGTA